MSPCSDRRWVYRADTGDGRRGFKDGCRLLVSTHSSTPLDQSPLEPTALVRAIGFRIGIETEEVGP
jgi:hypothetical protein